MPEKNPGAPLPKQTGTQTKSPGAGGAGAKPVKTNPGFKDGGKKK